MVYDLCLEIGRNFFPQPRSEPFLGGLTLKMTLLEAKCSNLQA